MEHDAFGTGAVIQSVVTIAQATRINALHVQTVQREAARAARGPPGTGDPKQLQARQPASRVSSAVTGATITFADNSNNIIF